MQRDLGSPGRRCVADSDSVVNVFPGRPAEMTNAVLFVAFDEARCMTG